jgi:1-acyl-sn-glycerol-3-phosphate acyltransferase
MKGKSKAGPPSKRGARAPAPAAKRSAPPKAKVEAKPPTQPKRPTLVPKRTTAAPPATAAASGTPTKDGPLAPGPAPSSLAPGGIAPDLTPGVAAPQRRDSDVPPSASQDPAVMEERIRELEARLDRMSESAARAPRSAPPPPPPLSSRLLSSSAEDGSLVDTAREVLSPDFFLRTWGRLGMRNRSEEVDDFGHDPIYEAKVLPVLTLLYERYFRVSVDGAAHIPSGRAVLVANHSGTVPWDGLMLMLAVQREHPEHRMVRWLVEDLVFHFPFVGAFATRMGAVRACQENAERLLDRGALLAVFPEGGKGIGKLFRDRYKLQRFGRGGFVKLCLRMRAPIVPVAIVGSEETNPMLGRIEMRGKGLGIPYLPVTPTFPMLGPLGLLPAPTKWRILFGEPLALDAHPASAADDEVLVGKLTEQVRASIQGMVDGALRERRSVFFG